MALVIDDVQWADRRSEEVLSFTLRRLSVDSVAVIAIIRGDREQLDAAARQLLLSMPRRQRMVLSGLSVEDVAPLAAALGAGQLDPDAIQHLHDRTGGPLVSALDDKINELGRPLSAYKTACAQILRTG